MRKLFLVLMTLIACTWSLAAQTRTYHGTIVDAANNEPLIGATIMPVGGGNGAAADIDGNFTVTVPANVKKATFSYVGYDSKTLDLHDGMTVKLSSGDVTLDNVVVVAYGTASKESLTGSVAVVGSKEIEDRPITSATSALEGNAPGVMVNSAVGAPGTPPSIAIRGFNSITGSTSPLYVVDGVPYEGSIADINPADIESMSVLKDAASSALYGNRGANGVILVTTKRAKKVGKVDVTLQIRQGMYNRGLPFYDRMDANEWMQTSFNGIVNGLVTNPTADYDTQDAINYGIVNFISDYAKLNIYGGVDADGNPIGLANDQLFDTDGKFLGQNILPGYAGDLDWWKPVSRTGYRQEYNINAAAAGEKYNVFASVGYLKENGYMLQTDFERFNGRINANFNPVSYFKFGVNLAATAQESAYNASVSDLGLATNPFLTMFTAPIYPYYAHNLAGNVILDDNGSPEWNTAAYLGGTNVAAVMRLDKKNNSATVIDGSIYGTAVIPYGFELTVRGNIHRDKTNAMTYMNNIVGDAANLGRLSESFYNIKNHTFMQTLEWNHDYGLHHVDVLLDHENYETWQDYSSVSVYGQTFEDMIALGNFENVNNPTESIVKLRSESYLGRARYNYDNRYFGEFSVRRDGTSVFGPGNRWGTFWSIGGSWIISSEKFMEQATWVDYLKLRAAYGSVGNDATAGSYAYLPLYGTLPYWGVNTLIPVQLAANNIRWESTNTVDVGIEGNLWHKLNFSLGYYYKLNEDLLYDVSQATSTGMTSSSGAAPTVLTNIGSMQNHGFEIGFGYKIFDRPDFYWDVNVDASFLVNKIKKLPGGRDIPGQSLFQGKSLGVIYTYDWVGIDEANGRSLYSIDPSSPDWVTYSSDTGEFSHDLTEAAYQDAIARAEKGESLVEIDGKYYTYDTQYAGRKIVGDGLPTVWGSFSTNLSWKGINLGLLFTYSLGGKIYDSNYLNLMAFGTQPGALHKDLLKAWTQAPADLEEGQHRIDPKGIPQVNTYYGPQSTAGSSQWLVSKSNLVLKNINLSYDLPSKWVNALKLSNINLGVSIDNVFIVAARKGLNPGYGFGGSQGASYVPARVFSFQLGAKF